MKRISITFICIALMMSVLGTPKAWAKTAPAPPVVPLTAKGSALEARYAAQLKEVQTALKQAMPMPSETQRAAYLKARQDENSSKANMNAVEKNGLGQIQSKTKHREWLIKTVIPEAEDLVQSAKAKLKSAKTEADVGAANKEVEKWARNQQNYVANLKKTEDELSALKAKEPTLKQALETAKDEYAKAQAAVIEAAAAFGLDALLSSDKLDAQLAKYVVLLDATPRGLAEFAEKSQNNEKLVEALLGNPTFMLQMLIGDGAQANRYGEAMQIYTDIRKASSKAADGVLQRLALAVSLEFAVQQRQADAEAPTTDAPDTIDPVKRYLHYEKAYLAGELDPAFKDLSVWELRMVVEGGERDEDYAWGREMLQTFRPDLIHTSNEGWRYVKIVSTSVPYGSRNGKYYDTPELSNVQNILMNGGICGRRAGFGRFILRSFGIPTTARPSRKHAALVRWTSDGWVPCLGPGWGSGWTMTRYGKDLDFLATTQARSNSKAYMKVKRAYWVGDVMGEKRSYGSNDKAAFWNGVALYTQQNIIKEAKAVALEAVGEALGQADAVATAEDVPDSPVNPEDKEIIYGKDGVISIPAAAYSSPSGETTELITMKSFSDGLQVLLPGFGRNGARPLRGGTFKDDSPSGARRRSGGYAFYQDWGFRAAVTPTGNDTPAELTFDLGDGVKMEFVYIKPGTFTMGGDSTEEGRFQCVEVPKHEVTITKGFYLGKYEVTQAQFETIMAVNPNKSPDTPNHPVGNIHEDDAAKFCDALALKTRRDVRLPTEAEWEYACRAGSDTKWFFGDDASQLGEYAWCKANSGGKSYPVGQKKPNPWGLYDMYGNVCERVNDAYEKNDYALGPKVDPTGPAQPRRSFDYKITAPRAGKYALTARVATPTAHQALMVSANGATAEIAMRIPCTLGKWHDSTPVTITLKEGANTLQFSRQPPQRGMAIKSFTLKPVP